jgi:hypothetical protein
MIRVAVMESLCWPMRACIHVIPHTVDGDYSRYSTEHKQAYFPFSEMDIQLH